MELHVRLEGEGLHPSEAMVAVETVDGARPLVVSKKSIVQNYIEVGLIREQGDKLLVELPRETESGQWRVWVRRDQVRNRESILA
ncbi:hypothetical protein NVS89_02060 [Ancylobacter sp. MQZ15Z-1]|uniref:Uncharacterized protein n=1 Tax=Ancylobacter mangrovi TaxID=2972472 RepID=A0A9X2T2J1_9HYPH|nr:hypothetical protein [Ancylobacter mangrovi]MCS0493866.1 hypothetical protein [Ancylobacter mangrovi]